MTIFQAVLFHDPPPEAPEPSEAPRPSEALGPAVWAGFQEVEAFFKRSDKRRDDTFRRYYLAEHVPEALKSKVTAESEAVCGRLYQSFWENEDTRGLYDGTYELAPLVAEARRLIGPDVNGQPLVVVTNVMLSTLPKDFFEKPDSPPPLNRYYMSMKVGDNSVIISLKPMDPSYWDIKDEKRINTVKRRFRAAGCRSTCQLLGVGNCGTPGCFMHLPLLTPVKLDGMNHLCEKHPEALDLQGYGFPSDDNDPTVVQEPVPVQITDR